MLYSKAFSSILSKVLIGTAITSANLAKKAESKLVNLALQKQFSFTCSRNNFWDYNNYNLLVSQPSRKFHTSGLMLKSSKADPSEVDPKWAENPKLIPNEEWAKRLNPEQYFCTREGGTEPPFSGQYLNHKAEGLYTCVCCGSELFSSKTKYDSGSGWPSFYAATEPTPTADGTASNGVTRRKDISHGMVRNEIICKNCNAHLGHVFEDGPEPSGERYCVNSAALKFVPKKL